MLKYVCLIWITFDHQWLAVNVLIFSESLKLILSTNLSIKSELCERSHSNDTVWCCSQWRGSGSGMKLVDSRQILNGVEESNATKCWSCTRPHSNNSTRCCLQWLGKDNMLKIVAYGERKWSNEMSIVWTPHIISVYLQWSWMKWRWPYESILNLKTVGM